MGQPASTMSLVPVFDVFGTLIERHLPVSSARVLAKYSGVSREVAKAAISPLYPDADRGRIIPQEWARRVLTAVGDDPDRWAEFLKLLIDEKRTAYRFLPDAEAALDLAATFGRIGLASNLTFWQLPVVRDVFGLFPGERVTCASYSYLEQSAKPEPGIYRSIAGKLGRELSDCLMIDDTLACVLGAEAIGMRGVAVLHQAGSLAQKLQETGAYDDIAAELKPLGYGLVRLSRLTDDPAVHRHDTQRQVWAALSPLAALELCRRNP